MQMPNADATVSKALFRDAVDSLFFSFADGFLTVHTKLQINRDNSTYYWG